jgi:putative NADPH-quinone reductase
VNILLVFCHPAGESFQRSILDELSGRLQADGHDLRTIDLYAEGFDPVLDAEGWRAHLQARPHDAGLEAHIAALQAAEGLIFVYPTWWYGLPAMLKGWIDRVWQPGVAFAMENGVFKTRYLARLRRFAVITTCGSPRAFIEWIVGDPARRQLMRGLALQLPRGGRTLWRPIYAVDARSPADLAQARSKAVSSVARLFREPNGGAARS